jgi:hypothetical protein
MKQMNTVRLKSRGKQTWLADLLHDRTSVDNKNAQSLCSQRVQDWRKEKEKPTSDTDNDRPPQRDCFVKRSRRGTSEKVNTNQAVESRALQDRSSNERSGPTIGHVYVLDSLNHVPPARENLTIESHGDGICKRKLVNCLNTPHT